MGMGIKISLDCSAVLEGGEIIASIETGSGKCSRKRNKGNSFLGTLKDYTVIDLETTGLDPEYDDIIEFGAIKVRNGEEVDSFSSLVNPEYEIDEFISSLTGITNEMLSNAPTMEKVLPDFLNFVGSDIVIGHNVNFDINFIYDTKERLISEPFSNDFIDTMRLSRRLYPEEKHHRLSDLTNRFCIFCDDAHRALADVRTTYQCYKYLSSVVEQKGLQSTLSSTKKHSCSAKDIVPTTDTFDPDSPVFGKEFVFTGALERMPRKDAMQEVVNRGGLCGNGITRNTNYLVLGNNDYCTTIKDGKSAKQKKAESMKLAGSDIEIISENVFYEMLDCGTPTTGKEENHVSDLEKLRCALKNEISDDSCWKAIQISENKDSSISVKTGGALVIKAFPSKKYIQFKSNPGEGFPQAIQGEDGLFKSKFESFDEILGKASEISSIILVAITSTVESFGCCQRYVECSDALKCTNPDKNMAKACIYRTNLESGRVFYGKNKNIQ